MTDEVTDPAGEVGTDIGLGHPDADLAKVFEDEALRVVQAGEQTGIPLRIIGALAFHHHCPQFGWIQAKLNRVYTDIDSAGYGKQSSRSVISSPDRLRREIETNAFYSEGGRLIFNNPTNTSTSTSSWTVSTLPSDPLEGPA